MNMSLTTGRGPFGTRPAGHFNQAMPEFAGLLYLEPFAPRIRGLVGEQTVLDSTSSWMLHEHGQLQVLYFPTADVRMDLLAPNGVRSRSPGKGEAAHYRLAVGDRIVEEAAWTFPDPEMDGLAGLIAFYFPTMQTWLQEDEPLVGHARNPYHRIDVFDTSRHVKVLVNDRPIAETARARVLYESGLPPRWYLPLDDVDRSLLESSPTRTTCAYKGHARYVSVRVDDQVESDLAWIYDEPLHDAARVAGYVCFWNERVDLEIDGEPVPRPVTDFVAGPLPLLGILPPDVIERIRRSR
jgi:uncharacterized protein (DUF427 family)